MKRIDIKQELESKSRDELNIIATKLKIKNRHKLKSEDLVSSILENDNKKVSKILHVTLWDKYHMHVYGIFSIIGVILVFVYPRIFDNNNLATNTLSDSELAVKSTIVLESNLLETFLFDDNYYLKVFLQNESDNNWHDLDINVFTLYFINDEPCLSQDRGPFVHKITKDVAFLEKAKSLELNLSFWGDYYHFPQLDKVIIDNIKVKDGFLNPFLFSKTFDTEETEVKFSVDSKNIENKLFRLALNDLFKQKSFLPMIFQLMRNKESKFAGSIDFILITGKSRSDDNDYSFLKLFPVINMWYSNEKEIQYAHNFLIINSACDFQNEYLMENDILINQKSQTTIIHTDPNKDKIIRRMESTYGVAVKIGQIELGQTQKIKSFGVNYIILSSPDQREFKSLKTVKFNTEVYPPRFDPLPGNIKLKPCN